jgi:myo-inositol-1(or 4)-monophosphatase
MRTEPSLEELLDCAITAAYTAGNHAAKNIKRNKDYLLLRRHDVKLALDMECQLLATKVIRKQFGNNMNIGGEEDFLLSRSRNKTKKQQKEDNVLSHYRWVIDPIDGTVNFSHGMKIWCTSVAVLRDETVIAGAIYSPMLNELYTATIESHACLNGKPIHVSEITELKHSIVCTGLRISSNEKTGTEQSVLAIGKACQRVRMIGSAALDMCYVACGIADGYFEAGIYEWDISAGKLLVERAGGKVEILARLEGGRLAVLATNGKIHQKLKKVVLPKQEQE